MGEEVAVLCRSVKGGAGKVLNCLQSDAPSCVQKTGGVHKQGLQCSMAPCPGTPGLEAASIPHHGPQHRLTAPSHPDLLSLGPPTRHWAGACHRWICSQSYPTALTSPQAWGVLY